MIKALRITNYIPKRQFDCLRCGSTIGYEIEDRANLYMTEDDGVACDLCCPVCGYSNRVIVSE